MRQIRNLLGKYFSLTPPHQSVRLTIQRTLQEKHQISVSIEHIHYKSGVVTVAVGSSAKSVILIKKQQVLKDLAAELGEKIVQDLR